LSGRDGSSEGPTSAHHRTARHRRGSAHRARVRETDPSADQDPAFLDADAAFEVQRINVEEAVSRDDRMVGYKLDNIAKVMQDA
jgi:2-keto-4-pentenoate hydratase